MDEFKELLKKFDDSLEPDPQPPLGKVLVIDDGGGPQKLDKVLSYMSDS